MPGARATNLLVKIERRLLRAAMCSICAGIATLFVALSLGSGGAYGIQTSYSERKSDLSGISVIEKNHEIRLGTSDEPVPNSETGVTDSAVEQNPEPPSLVQDDSTFFDRFAAALDSAPERTARGDDTREANNDPLTLEITAPLPPPPKKRLRVADLPKAFAPPPDANGHTAIYDIASHVVYLPNGRRLEAHSGLGSHLDVARDVNLKGRGPTPPNVYALTLRERPFHGVRAIRLIPVGDGDMFGRDGMLAHSYMLGPDGQSNGCVSFRDYPAFLNAFLAGEVDRLVVVDNLASTHSPETDSRSLPDIIKNMFTRS